MAAGKWSLFYCPELPGGITIKGINELEHNGFTSAIIKAMKASK